MKNSLFSCIVYIVIVVAYFATSFVSMEYGHLFKISDEGITIITFVTVVNIFLFAVNRMSLASYTAILEKGAMVFNPLIAFILTRWVYNSYALTVYWAIIVAVSLLAIYLFSKLEKLMLNRNGNCFKYGDNSKKLSRIPAITQMLVVSIIVVIETILINQWLL